MESWGLVLVVGSLLSATLAFIWTAVRLGGKKGKKDQQFTDAAEQDVEHIFNNEFREELRNRGRLHFEKIIGENAMFLQQDLRLTTSQLNDFMKTEITRKLQDEFAKYEESITDAKQLAIDSIAKTQSIIEQQRQILQQEIEQQAAVEKARMMEQFNKNMSEIVNHYVIAAIGKQLDLSDQLEYILADLEENKKAIMEDIRRGA
jgi:DNA-nicking Smr family endonuclease